MSLRLSEKEYADLVNKQAPKERRHKMGAKKKEIDGFKFDSIKEANRYIVLRAMMSFDEISDLEVHPKFPIVVNDIKVCTYIADFRYLDGKNGGTLVVEDVKSAYTRKLPVYRLKKKLLFATLGITIVEV